MNAIQITASGNVESIEKEKPKRNNQEYYILTILQKVLNKKNSRISNEATGDGVHSNKNSLKSIEIRY